MKLQKIIPKNKRGDVTDSITILLIMFFLAVSFIVVIFTNTKIKDAITNTSLNDSSISTNIADALDTVNTTTVQRGYTLMIGLLIVGIIGSSFLVRIHPVFIFIYIIVLSFAIFISVFLANAYEKLISTEVLSVIAADQGMITFFMQHLVMIILVVGALSMIIVFAKLFGGGGGSPFGNEGIR